MRPRQSPDAHQELADDLAAHELELALHELDPLRLVERTLRVEPRREGAVLGDEGHHALRVVDGGVDLQAIADDAGVGEETVAIDLAIAGDHVRIEAVVGAPETLALLQDGLPRQPGLVDLEDEPLEEPGVVAQREAVFGVVVRAVDRVARRDGAVGHGAFRSASIDHR